MGFPLPRLRASAGRGLGRQSLDRGVPDSRHPDERLVDLQSGGLTRRILGPTSTATIQLDVSAMRDGDVAGLALLRQASAWVGINRASGANRVVMVSGLDMDSTWNTTSTGSEVEGTAFSGSTIWLRVAADIRPGANRQGKFSYSTDGTAFTPIGSAYTLNNRWQFFMGYRYAMFNYATTALGGLVTLKSFEVSTP